MLHWLLAFSTLMRWCASRNKNKRPSTFNFTRRRMGNHKERSYRMARHELMRTSLRVLIVVLEVIRPVLIAKSKGERSFEVHQVEPEERRRSARRHYVDSQPPKMRRNWPESDLFIKREACRPLFASCPLRYIPKRRVSPEASITKSERHHQNLQGARNIFDGPAVCEKKCPKSFDACMLNRRTGQDMRCI